MRVGGTIGDASSGARVVINDPQGKFGRRRASTPRFSIDEDNPTVRSETGYPMCLPRTDPTDDRRSAVPAGEPPEGMRTATT